MQDEPMGGKGCPLRIVGCLISSWKARSLHIFYIIKQKRRDQVQRFETIANWHKQYGPVGALIDLERMGLVSKKIYPEIPPRVEYTICDAYGKRA